MESQPRVFNSWLTWWHVIFPRRPCPKAAVAMSPPSVALPARSIAGPRRSWQESTRRWELSRCGGSAYTSKYLPEGSWWFALKKKVNKYPVLEISYGNSSLGGWKFLFWQVFFGQKTIWSLKIKTDLGRARKKSEENWSFLLSEELFVLKYNL